MVAVFASIPERRRWHNVGRRIQSITPCHHRVEHTRIPIQVERLRIPGRIGEHDVAEELRGERVEGALLPVGLPGDPRPPSSRLGFATRRQLWTDAAGVAGEGYGMGVATADYDNDGFADLFLPGVNRNVLYRNRGDGTFEDVTRRAGLEGIDPELGKTWAIAAGWFDYDNDGRLDIVLSGGVGDFERSREVSEIPLFALFAIASTVSLVVASERPSRAASATVAASHALALFTYYLAPLLVVEQDLGYRGAPPTNTTSLVDLLRAEGLDQRDDTREVPRVGRDEPRVLGTEPDGVHLRPPVRLLFPSRLGV